MKRKPDYNKHVLRMFKRAASLPRALTLMGWRSFGGWFSTTASRRARDVVRQSRVRRGLRGLSPDHAQLPHAAKESGSREIDALPRR